MEENATCNPYCELQEHSLSIKASHKQIHGLQRVVQGALLSHINSAYSKWKYLGRDFSFDVVGRGFS